jgi:hypothetical protein
MAEGKSPKTDPRNAEVRIHFYNAKTKKPVAVADLSFRDPEGKVHQYSAEKHGEDGISHYRLPSEGLWHLQIPPAKTECEVLTPRSGKEVLFRAKHEECCCLEIPFDSVTLSGIAGCVQDQNKKTIPGVPVEVARVDETSEFNSPASVLRVNTGPCGEFEVRGLEPGLYLVAAIPEPPFTFQNPENAVQSVHLCGTTIEQIQFTLRHTFSYQRVVLVNDSGEPWEGATITLCAEHDTDDAHPKPAVVQNGIAVFENLSRGPYLMAAVTKDNEKLALSDDILNVASGSQIKVVQATEVDSIVISGQLLTQDGEPMRNQTINFLKRGSTQVMKQITTNEAGVYKVTLPQLPGGSRPAIDVEVAGQRWPFVPDGQLTEEMP